MVRARALQRLRAVGNRNLRQPVFRERLVGHRQAALLEGIGAGAHEQAQEVRARGRAHAAEDADDSRE
jgi:hypothetical protein